MKSWGKRMSYGNEQHGETVGETTPAGEIVGENDVSRNLRFVDPTNHRNTLGPLIIIPLVLPLFVWLIYLASTKGIYSWAVIMGVMTSLAFHGWYKGLYYYLNPHEYGVEFTPEGIRVWNTDEPPWKENYIRWEVSRFLIDASEKSVTFGLKSSRWTKGFYGIYWTQERLTQLEEFLTTQWPEVRVDRL